ncbi:uncharacterized protein LOC124204257 [Daphnia pulex]|uniref:uncharacterized protein LOC124204257 n=1 Tax=Daphnia pulex TaxID=6669 RepID=UPI001EE14FDB|nr:uncharacterized protein LOC124204257 [Daphnia pulex]
MKLIASMWFKRKKAMRNRAGVVRRPKVVGGKKVEFEGFVDPWPDASRKFLSIVLFPVLRCCTMANTYLFQRIFLLAVLMANSFRLNSAMFEQPDSQSKEQMDATPTCFRRPYTFKVYQEDSEGRSCWDVVTVTSCWGRCSSNEIADWRFPFKRSQHPVCQHDSILPRAITLRNCDPEVNLGTELYMALDAVTCRCELCRTDTTNCEGPHYDRRITTRRLN